MPQQQEAFTGLISDTKQNQDPMESGMRLFQGIGQAFVSADGDKEKIKALSDELHAKANALVRAIVERFPQTTQRDQAVPQSSAETYRAPAPSVQAQSGEQQSSSKRK